MHTIKQTSSRISPRGLSRQACSLRRRRHKPRLEGQLEGLNLLLARRQSCVLSSQRRSFEVAVAADALTKARHERLAL